ncbi:GNS1/SUR4 family-domain-containing protein [Lophiotrema nucula]|uniref:Elongation of fatty acids protein n=1 Tax=Lophiotrema nucula TaxID=690887 RepID=A0A6A5ZMB5_9PLEO|nr:GNS1/SUR4 family-domain-containing protein [Lophiotrema nucula]
MSGAGPTLFLGALPSRSLFKFPPNNAPRAIPPPFGESSFKAPFGISDDVYNKALDARVPITIATVYAASVFALNWYNRRHGNKPWALSKTRAFRAFVILHNVFLAVYSAVTFVAMVRTLKHSIPHYSEPNALVGTVDALCKMNGPRGLGDAATFSPETSTWGVRNPLIRLGHDGLPDTSDVGRIWNEGLAFWGWFFYLSKFYEVVDTAIIIAKGKRSTTLQTYHHSGAMMSMWAGIRYMSPPIWMFVLVNAGIHAMMYTYYTVSALGVRVPQAVKRTLTSLQILQFVVGTTFAGIHLFMAYTVPVSVAYKAGEALSNLSPSSISSAVSSATSAVPMTSATAAGVALLKKLVYRAAGEEGLAENIHGAPDAGFALGGHRSPQQVIQDKVERTIYRTEYQTVPCIDTTGQTFAVYLNMIYLLPLTGLFVRFFVKSYLRRTSSQTKHATKKRTLSKSVADAMHGVDREIESLGRAAEDGVGNVIKSAKNARNNARGRSSGNTDAKRVGSLSPANQKFIDSFQQRVKQGLKQLGEDAEGTPERAKRVASEVGKKLEAAAKDSNKKSDKANGELNGDAKQPANGVKKEGEQDEKPNGINNDGSDEKETNGVNKEENEEPPNNSEAGDEAETNSMKKEENDENQSEQIIATTNVEPLPSQAPADGPANGGLLRGN